MSPRRVSALRKIAGFRRGPVQSPRYRSRSTCTEARNGAIRRRPANPSKASSLAEVLLENAMLTQTLPWIEDKTADGAVREAFLLELQCTSGTTNAWGIIERARAMFIGAVLARETLGGTDIEVLCASQYRNQGIADEVSVPVGDWLEQYTEVQIGPPQ